MFNGSGANVLCLRAACRPWEAVICAETAHLNVDEGGAPEAIAGVKLLTVPRARTASSPRSWCSGASPASATSTPSSRASCRSRSAPSSARSTRLEEVRALAELAHDHGLLLHVDGARLGNAAAALDCSLAQASGELGVDILSFGGTKNGLLGAEAVVVL